MASTNTAIEWTDKTWNPTTGCNKISSGCKHCYAEVIATRFTNHFPNGFDLTLHPERLKQPYKWKTPSRIFVNSMSDLFHDDVPTDFIVQVFEAMSETPWHVYQVLTKRHERLVQMADLLSWPDNVWMGVSIESQQYTSRLDALKTVPARVKFLSCEPLIGPLELDLQGIDWVIVGGESGQGFRAIEESWVRDILRQSKQYDVAFFFKQWGGRTPKSGGRELDQMIWDEMPKAWRGHVEKWGTSSIRKTQFKR